MESSKLETSTLIRMDSPTEHPAESTTPKELPQRSTRQRGGVGLPTSSKRLLRQIPRNTDADGCARCLKAGYYKMGAANFTKHEGDGFVATCIIEIWE